MVRRFPPAGLVAGSDSSFEESGRALERAAELPGPESVRVAPEHASLAPSGGRADLSPSVATGGESDGEAALSRSGRAFPAVAALYRIVAPDSIAVMSVCRGGRP